MECPPHPRNIENNCKRQRCRQREQERKGRGKDTTVEQVKTVTRSQRCKWGTPWRRPVPQMMNFRTWKSLPSQFDLKDRHLRLLSGDFSFSLTSRMDQFEIYKDINLFLRKVYLRLVHSGVVGDAELTKPLHDERYQQAINELISLMEEWMSDEDAVDDAVNTWKRQANLTIRSTKMPQIRKNHWIGVFLDLV